MSALDDYLRRKGTDPLGQSLGPEGQKFLNLLRTVNTYNVNRVGGRALSLAGSDIDPSGLTAERKPGILATAGKVWNAPRKGLFRVLGLDPELSGGDVFRTSGKDNLFERAGKLAGAFAFDVATDPTTYIGAPGVIGRKAVVETAASPAVRKLALSVGEEALQAAGRNADDVIEALYRNNALTKYADIAAEKTAAGVAAGEIEKEAVEAASGLALRQQDLIKAGKSAAEAQQIVRRELAEEELGRIVSESILTGGRKRAMDNLTRVFGSEDVARSVFNRLPDEVRGGILLRSPWGSTIGRVPFTGGGTTFGRAAEMSNAARFNATERIGRTIFGKPMIDPATGLLKMSGGITGGAGTSGYFGPAWQQVRAGLREAMSKPGFDLLKDNLGRTTTTTYNEFRRAHRAMSAARTTGMFAVWRSLGETRALERDWADKGLREDYVRGVWIGYHTPDEAGFGAANAAEQAGIDQARRLRAEMNAWRDKQVEAGLDISDLGPGYQPLMLTPAEQRRIIESRPRGAGIVGDELAYTPEVQRAQWIVPEAEAKAKGLTGFKIPGTDNIALNAVSINKLVGRDAYITDPLQIAEKYMERAAKTVAQKKFVDDALRAGVLVADADYAKTQARFDRLATFMSGIRKASPQLADQVVAAKKASEEELTRLTAAETRNKTIKEAAQERIKYSSAYNTANARQAAIAADLRAATDAVDAARPRRADIAARLDEYAQSGAVQRREAAAQASERAGRRFRAAEKKLEEANQEVDFTRALVAEFGDEAQQLADDSFAAAEGLVDPYIVSKEARQVAADELAGARAMQRGMRQQLTDDELRQIAEFEAALVRQQDLVRQYEAARDIRRKAAADWQRVRKAPAVQSAEQLNTLARDYANKLTAVRRAEQDRLPKEQLKELRKIARDARTLLRQAVGYNFEKGSVINAYRDKLVEVAEKLSADEFSAATVLSAEGKLVPLLQQMEDAYVSNDMAAITSTAEAIKETYFSIRNKISIDDLTGLNTLEKAALSKEVPGELPLLKEVAAKTEYGKWLTETDIKQLATSAGTGDVRLPGRLAGLHATSGVRAVMEKMYQAETTGAFRSFVNDITDPLLLMWKTGVTVGRGPGYVISNLIGGIYMSFLGGVSAGSLAEGAQILNAFRNAYKQAQDQLPKAAAPEQLELAATLLKKSLAGRKIGKRAADAVLREFLEFGGYGSTQTVEALQQFAERGLLAPERALQFGETVRRRGQELVSPVGRGYQKVVDLALANPYQRVMNDWAQGSELFLRFGTYLDTIKKFDDPMMALDRVNLLHFDYADLSEAEQTIRRLVPFYTWMRHNVPLQLRAMVLEPGKIKKWMYLQENIKKQLEEDEDSWYQQLLPEYLQDVGGFVSRIATNEGPLAFGSRMPYDDINRLFKVGGSPIRGSELFKMIGPATTLPLSLATGTNIDTGAAFAPEGIEATGYQALLARVPGLGKTGAEGERRVSSRAAYAVTEALPQLSFVDRLLSTTPATRPLATKPQQQRALSNLLNVIGLPAAAGFSVTTLTPESMTGEARKRIDKQNAILEEAAGKMNVSLEWLRAQIRAGYTSEEIALMIRRGEGNREKYEEGKAKRAKGLDPRYERMLREMGRGRIELGY